jgi:DNA-binding response OmpR family regulator
MARKSKEWNELLEEAMELRRIRVLLAEDDDELRELLASTLTKDGYEVIQVADGTGLFDYLSAVHIREGHAEPIDLIVTDIQMPGWTGLQVLQSIRERDWATPVILITGFGNREVHKEASRLGATAFFDKPFDVDDLRTAVLNLTGGDPNRFSGLGL